MDSQNDTSHGVPNNPDKGSRSAEREDEDEEVSQFKYRRVDREGGRAPSTRFLFVDSSSSGQRPRSDQRAINAHIQQTAHRNRREAAATLKSKPEGGANIGRYRREAQIQPRPIVPQRTPSATPSAALEQRSSPESEAPPTPRPPTRPRLPEVEQGLLDRLRHYSNVRAPEVRHAINSQREHERRESFEFVQRAPEEEHNIDETSSVRSMLTQILQRLDAGNRGHSIQDPSSAMRSTVLDPFNISSVVITPSMNAVLRHFADVMLPGVFPTRQQAEMQTRWAFQCAAQDPLVLYSLLAISSAERSARLGELRNGSQETTFSEEDLENRIAPDFASYKVSAVKLANETMRSMDTATKASTIFAMMCLLSIEVSPFRRTRLQSHQNLFSSWAVFVHNADILRRSSPATKRRFSHTLVGCKN